MSRLPSPPLPSLLLPLLLLSLLASCLQQAGNCGAAAVVPEEKEAAVPGEKEVVDGEHPVTDGVHSESEGLPTPTEDLPTPTEDLPTEEDDDMPAGFRTWWAVCGAGQYNLLGRCHRQRGAGTLCLADSWCRSGRCRLGLCRRGPADCRSGRPACSDGQQCVSQADGWRCRAEDGTLALGAACSLDSECASGTCSAEGSAAGTCVCPAGFTACAGHCCSVPTDVEATPVCPDGFTSCSGHCYHADATLTGYTYTVAEQYCIGMGAILATPRSAAENTCAADVAVASGGGEFWIGYRGGTTADSFVGADGAAMSFNNWIAVTPNLYYDDNCVTLSPLDENWIDTMCQNPFKALCQTMQN